MITISMGKEGEQVVFQIDDDLAAGAFLQLVFHNLKERRLPPYQALVSAVWQCQPEVALQRLADYIIGPPQNE